VDNYAKDERLLDPEEN